MTKTILIVDEHWDVLETLETLLKKNGYKVLTAKNLGDCLEKIKKTKPNLLLIGYIATKGAILDVATKINGLKIAYLVTDKSEEDYLNLYANVVGFINQTKDINEVLLKIGELLK